MWWAFPFLLQAEVEVGGKERRLLRNLSILEKL